MVGAPLLAILLYFSPPSIVLAIPWGAAILVDLLVMLITWKTTFRQVHTAVRSGARTRAMLRCVRLVWLVASTSHLRVAVIPCEHELILRYGFLLLERQVIRRN